MRAGVIAACSALLLLTGCTAGTTDSSEGNAAQGPLVRIALGVDASYAPLYLAQQKGLFAKAGLNVQLMQTEGGPAASQAVQAGTAQLALQSNSTALSLMAASDDLRALGVFESSDRYLKVVLRKGIDKPQQIKTMASIPGIGLYSTYSYLRYNKIDPASVKILSSSAPEIPALLTRGSIDGYVLFDPWVTKGVEGGGHIAGQIGDFGVGFRQWLVAGRTWLEKNEDLAGKVFQVIAQADEMVTADPKAAAEATEKEVKIPAAQTVKALPEINFKARGFTDEDYTNDKKLVDFLLEQKLIKKAPDLQTVMLKGWYEQHVRP
ncbi:ABC transporter substrate-binding protein [Nonomuraea sp. NPDC050783]|uniref:ABC transporter substrate-binding protein n=1 Tax=Nonomuraea sp. NPDC050783 TaxID=3154634 RepID=UPI003464F5DD